MYEILQDGGQAMFSMAVAGYLLYERNTTMKALTASMNSNTNMLQSLRDKITK